MAAVIVGAVVVGGQAEGRTLVTHEALSFWGGYDAADGTIIDHRHPLHGERAADRVLVLPGSRGSSTTSAVLLEALRNHTAPAAIVTLGVDTFIALSVVVAQEMYGEGIPVLAVDRDVFASIPNDVTVVVRSNGRITLADRGRKGNTPNRME